MSLPGSGGNDVELVCGVEPQDLLDITRSKNRRDTEHRNNGKQNCIFDRRGGVIVTVQRLPNAAAAVGHYFFSEIERRTG